MPKREPLLKPAIMLFLICLVTTGLLAATYAITKEEIARQEDLAANANRRDLIPTADQFIALDIPASQREDIKEAFAAKDSDGKTIGWLITGVRRGYGGPLPVLIAFDTQGQITGLKALPADETPGLGAKVSSDSFLAQFVELRSDQRFVIKTDHLAGQQIDAISGATISSRAVVEAVNEAASLVQTIQGGS